MTNSPSQMQVYNPSNDQTFHGAILYEALVRNKQISNMLPKNNCVLADPHNIDYFSRTPRIADSVNMEFRFKHGKQPLTITKIGSFRLLQCEKTDTFPMSSALKHSNNTVFLQKHFYSDRDSTFYLNTSIQGFRYAKDYNISKNPDNNNLDHHVLLSSLSDFLPGNNNTITIFQQSNSCSAGTDKCIPFDYDVLQTFVARLMNGFYNHFPQSESPKLSLANYRFGTKEGEKQIEDLLAEKGFKGLFAFLFNIPFDLFKLTYDSISGHISDILTHEPRDISVDTTSVGGAQAHTSTPSVKPTGTITEVAEA